MSGCFCLSNDSFLIVSKFNIWDVLRDLVLFVQFKKREKDPWRSADFF